MKIIGRLFLFCFALIALSWFSPTSKYEKKATRLSVQNNVTPLQSGNSLVKLKSIAAAARLFVKDKKFTETVCFLINLSLPSGQNRFFIYNLTKDTLEAAGLVAHGNCFENSLESRRYSNVVGSGCSSLGKYKIGNSYNGKFGYSYKLYGLEGTNDKAFERTVVLHAHTCIPASEVADDICQSNGCPMVSPSFLQDLKKIINHSAKPVLLWIYE